MNTEIMKQGDAGARLPANTRLLPTAFDREVVMLEVCERIAGGETLRAICEVTLDGEVREAGAFPMPRTVGSWVLVDPSIAERYGIARTLKADALFDEALDLSREIRARPGTSQKVRSYDVAMTHLRWASGKLNPSKYSERSPVAVTVPIQINTSLDLGQKGAVPLKSDENVYELQATIVEPDEAPQNQSPQATATKKRGGHKRGRRPASTTGSKGAK